MKPANSQWGRCGLRGVALTLALVMLAGCAAHFGYEVGDRADFVVQLPPGVDHFYFLEFNTYADRFPGRPGSEGLSNAAVSNFLATQVQLRIAGPTIRLPLGDFVFAYQCGPLERFERRMLTKASVAQAITLACL